MNIKRCYVENFGKFHQFEYHFSNGINVINEDNGWGKTTLATFIKAMFYGFDSTNKRAIDENERKKYFPWHGGKYGGNLEFEINGKTYEIERFFGQKDKEDTFKLYDKTTNRESKDYSQNIGEEIFKIDKEAYERSTYIPQQNISIKINDSLSAKLTNMLEGENDINSSDNAINNIILEMKEFKKNGNKGRINELENKIIIKKRQLENANNNEKIINDRNKKLSEINLRIKELENEKNKNIEIMEEINKNEKNILIKNRFLEYSDLVKQDENDIEKINNYFNNEIIEDSEIDKLEKNISELEILNSKLKDIEIKLDDMKKYNEEDKFYKEINEEIIDENYLKHEKIQNLDNEISLLNEKIKSEEKIEKIKEKNKKQKKNIKIVLSIILIIIGIILGKTIYKYLYSIIFIGMLLLFFTLINKKDKSKEREIEHLKKQLDEKQIEIEVLKNELEKFLSSFVDEKNSDLEKLNIIKNKYTNYRNREKIIIEEELKKQSIKNNIREINSQIYRQLKYFINEDDYNFLEKAKQIISEIKNKKRDLKNLLIKYENDKAIKQKYETENKVSDILLLDINNSKNNYDEIKIKNDSIIEELNKLINQKSYDENELNRLINTLETVEEIETEIQELENELSENNQKYNILDRTQKYLIKAKENFSARYLNNMTQGFNKYLKLINKEELNTNIDVKLNVKIKSNGENKDIDYFSTGYKDLIYICMRFALLDALFEDEKPFIILDDPFVNLDEVKIKKAKNVIEDFSKKYQIIYFTCHESRT